MEATTLEDYIASRSTCRRLRAGPARAHVDAFVESLVAEGYSSVTLDQICFFLGLLLDWMVRKGFGDDVSAGLVEYRRLESLGRLRATKSTVCRARRAGKHYVRFLQGQGLLQIPRSPLDVWPVLGSFHAWGRDQRGLAETTLHLYEDVLIDLLEELGDDPAMYTARRLRDFVVERARPHGRRRGETIVCAVRAFLRFLVAVGRAREGMPDAIPRFASWRLSSLPRYLEPQAVRRVIDSCQPTTRVLRRDRAILLLLSRLGLRGGDVVRLRVDDIDWRDATLAVSGKSRRRERLPLPQDVGDAILGYIRHGRPEVRHAQVFLAARAPYRPLTSGAISQIASAALERAGVDSPSHGAHVFRHSAATAMLRQGASLSSIGAVLRHRLPDTTLQYAKVDLAALAEVAMPWPEVDRC
jgi:integrase/recombinase XerD